MKRRAEMDFWVVRITYAHLLLNGIIVAQYFNELHNLIRELLNQFRCIQRQNCCWSI